MNNFTKATVAAIIVFVGLICQGATYVDLQPDEEQYLRGPGSAAGARQLELMMELGRARGATDRVWCFSVARLFQGVEVTSRYFKHYLRNSLVGSLGQLLWDIKYMETKEARAYLPQEQRDAAAQYKQFAQADLHAASTRVLEGLFQYTCRTMTTSSPAEDEVFYHLMKAQMHVHLANTNDDTKSCDLDMAEQLFSQTLDYAYENLNGAHEWLLQTAIKFSEFLASDVGRQTDACSIAYDALHSGQTFVSTLPAYEQSMSNPLIEGLEYFISNNHCH